MKLQLVALGLLLSTVEAASVETGFQEEPIDEFLRKADLGGIEKVLANTWYLEPGSEAAKKVYSFWDDSIACRCASLARVHGGAYGAQGTWLKIMTALFPVDSKPLIDEHPLLSLCLLYPDFIPMPAPESLPEHWSTSLLFNPIISKKAIYKLNSGDSEALTSYLVDSMGMLGLQKRACWVAQTGDLATLHKMIEDIDLAIELQDLCECHADIVSSSNAIDILRLLQQLFPRRLSTFEFWEPLLIAASDGGKFKLFQQLYGNRVEGLSVSVSLDDLNLIKAMPLDLARELLDSEDLKYAVEANRLDIIRVAYEQSEKIPDNSAIRAALVDGPLDGIEFMEGIMGTEAIQEFILSLARDERSVDRDERSVDRDERSVDRDERLLDKSAVRAAVVNGSVDVIEFLESIMGTKALQEIIISVDREEKLLNDVLIAGKVDGLKILNMFIPELFPPKAACLVPPNSLDHVEAIQYIYQKMLEGVDPQVLGTPSPHRTEVMTGVIKHASSDFTPLAFNSVKLIRFFKSECTKYDVPFPEVTPEIIFNALAGNNREFLDSFEEIFGQPIPHLAELAPRFPELQIIKSWHMELFRTRDIMVNPTAQQLEYTTDLVTLQYFHERYPQLLHLEKVIFNALVSGREDVLDWVLSLNNIPKEISCHNLPLKPEHIPIYSLVRERYPQWLPTEEQMSEAAKLGHYHIVKWIFEISNGSVYPSAEAVKMIMDSGDILMLRLLDHLRPFSPEIIETLMDYMKNPRCSQKYKKDPRFSQWFPQLLS